MPEAAARATIFARLDVRFTGAPPTFRALHGSPFDADFFNAPLGSERSLTTAGNRASLYEAGCYEKTSAWLLLSGLILLGASS